MNKHFVFAKLSHLDCMGVRIGGAGLGNILFPWARAIVYAKINDLPLINTTWKSLKLGPLLRGELDTRGYNNLFKENNIKGIYKFFLLVLGSRTSEKSATSFLKQRGSFPKVLIFTGMCNQMTDIINNHVIVKNELIKITREENLRQIEKFAGHGISIHIRMGDFYIPESEDEIRSGKTNCRLPLEWYISVVNKIRSVAGDDFPVNVFSDGTDEELHDVLCLNNVTRRYYGSAISDMLALAKSDILIASNSTFSLWASYLGRMPTIYFPGTNREKIFIKNDEIEVEVDYTDELPNILKLYLNQKS